MSPRGGIDLGGTKIQAVVLGDENRVLGQARRPTPTEGGPGDVADAMAAALSEACDQAKLRSGELAGVGAGSPGDVDGRGGTVSRADNLPGWHEAYPLAAELQKRLGVPAHLGNDVSVATQAEFELGAARGRQSVLGVFWGTGVGGGLILDGRPWHGRGGAGEIGHTVVRRGGALCPCGRHGCLEAYAGRRAMEQRARERHRAGEETKLFRIMADRGRDRLTSGIWERALKDGDDLALRLIERALRALGCAIASAINLLDVEAVVLGGGLGVRFGPTYHDRLVAEMNRHLLRLEDPPPLLVAGLGDLGGAIGAALLVA